MEPEVQVVECRLCSRHVVNLEMVAHLIECLGSSRPALPPADISMGQFRLCSGLYNLLPEAWVPAVLGGAVAEEEMEEKRRAKEKSSSERRKKKKKDKEAKRKRNSTGTGVLGSNVPLISLKATLDGNDSDEEMQHAVWDEKRPQAAKKKMSTTLEKFSKALVPKPANASASVDSYPSGSLSSRSSLSSGTFSTSGIAHFGRNTMKLPKVKTKQQDLLVELLAMPQNAPLILAASAERQPALNEMANKALVAILCLENNRFLRFTKTGECVADVVISAQATLQADSVFKLHTSNEGTYKFSCKFCKSRFLWGKAEVVDSAGAFFLKNRKKELAALNLYPESNVVGPEGMGGAEVKAKMQVVLLAIPAPV